MQVINVFTGEAAKREYSGNGKYRVILTDDAENAVGLMERGESYHTKPDAPDRHVLLQSLWTLDGKFSPIRDDIHYTTNDKRPRLFSSTFLRGKADFYDAVYWWLKNSDMIEELPDQNGRLAFNFKKEN